MTAALTQQLRSFDQRVEPKQLDLVALGQTGVAVSHRILPLTGSATCERCAPPTLHSITVDILSGGWPAEPTTGVRSETENGAWGARSHISTIDSAVSYRTNA